MAHHPTRDRAKTASAYDTDIAVWAQEQRGKLFDIDTPWFVETPTEIGQAKDGKVAVGH